MKKGARLTILLFLALPVQAQMSGSAHRRDPYLPNTFISSTLNSANFADLFSTPVSKTVCASGCSYTSIQAAFDAISTDAPTCGEIITVTAGFVTTVGSGSSGPTYSTACPTNKHVWLRTSAYTSLPAQGTRVAASDQANMFEVDKTAGISSESAFTISDGSAGLIVTGMYAHVTATFASAIIKAGSSTNSTGFANHIWIDRCYLDADHTTSQTQRGIYLDADFFSITDSVIDGILHLNSDTCNNGSDYQDILSYNSLGPFKIVNNLLSGAPTENIMFGGSFSSSRTAQPADIEIRKNVLYKDPAYYETAVIKNLLEFKVGSRVLVDGNVLQYSVEDSVACAGSQKGTAIDFTPRSDGSRSEGATKYQVADITFTNNDIQHFNNAWSIQGHDDGTNPDHNTWPVTNRIAIKNNLFREISTYYTMGTDMASGGWNNTTGASISGNVATYSFASCCNSTWFNGTPMAVRGFTGADTVFNGLWNTIVSKPTNQVTMNVTAANQTATTNGQMSTSNYAIHSISLVGGFIYIGGKITPVTGPANLAVSHNAFYGSVCIAGYTCFGTSTNQAGVVYFNSAKGVGGTGNWPNLSFTDNITVTDAAGVQGDASPTVSALVSGGGLPGTVWSGNVFFNWTVSTGTNCANFPASGMASNPGFCLAGKSSSPITINSTLGISDYATCTAGDTTPGDSGSLSSCVITGTYAGKGPDISAIQAAQALGNDATNWGPRTVW